MDVHEHGAAGVGRVRDEDVLVRASVQLVDEPGIHSAEREVASFVRLADLLDIPQEPNEFCD